MTSVGNQQTVPYHRSYGAIPDPAAAEVRVAHEDSPTPPRAPVHTQQRAGFGTRHKIENASTTALSAKLQALSNENKQLDNLLREVVRELAPIITKLRDDITQLKQQMAASTNRAASPSQAPSGPSTQTSPTGVQRDQAMAPNSAETPFAADNASLGVESNSSNFKELSEENAQLREMINGLKTQFKALVEPLQEQVVEMKQQLEGSGPPERQVAPSPYDCEVPGGDDRATDSCVPASETAPVDARELASQDETAATDSNESTPEVQSSIDQLTRANEALRADIQEMIGQFKSVIADLQQQIAELTQQLHAKNV